MAERRVDVLTRVRKWGREVGLEFAGVLLVDWTAMDFMSRKQRFQTSTGRVGDVCREEQFQMTLLTIG